jgi:Domain of unknown function (DUF4398)
VRVRQHGRKIAAPTSYLSAADDVKKTAAVFLIVLISMGCQHNPPIEEYTLARTALSAAKKAGGNRYAPSYFHSAEESYLSGEARFKENEYDQSRELFVKARQFAEKAENIARLQKFKTGEVSP